MIRLRGHHLLCLHGFRGLGYSEEFTKNMQMLKEALKADLDQQVQVLDSPDDICAFCPHRSDNGCGKSGANAETKISESDRLVLERLSISPKDAVIAKRLFAQTADEFCGRISDICSSCSWLHLGWCAEGVENRVMLAGRVQRK